MRRFKWLSGSLALLLLMVLVGCSKTASTDQAELTRLKAENEQLKAKVAELEGGAVVNLVDANYPKATLGQAGWDYAKTTTTDLDGDGADEKVVMLANVQWDAAHSTWAWDDGHVWNVYVEEADGTRTYVFAKWVQLGSVEANVVEGQNGQRELVLMEQWNSIALDRIIYRGPQKVEARQVYRAPRFRTVAQEEGCIPGATAGQGRLSSAQAEVVIADCAQEAISYIAAKDMAKLAALAHPQKGIRFSPYAYVKPQQGGDLVFTGAKLAGVWQDTTIYAWGSFDGTGEPIKLTFPQYYDRFIYDLKFANAPQVSYNQSLGKGNTPDNSATVYPNGIVVEYHFPQVDPKNQGMDWRSLRLVFEQSGHGWYLVGIIHAQWTI